MSERAGRMGTDVSGIRVDWRDLPPDLERSIRDGWRPYLAAGDEAPLLDVAVRADLPDRVDPSLPFPSALDSRLTPDAATFVSPVGRIEVARDGRAVLTLPGGPASWRFRSAINLAFAALAWRLLDRPGAVLHAAGIVLDGRAFLLVGPSGAGKSTFAALAREAGAEVLSDDAVLLDLEGGRVVALAAPFRDHEATVAAPRRCPVAALLLPRWGDAAAIAPASRLHVEARVAANLLFVGGGWATDPRVAAAAGALVDRVAAHTLTFARDGSFAPLLRALPA